jgi:hypothetical protein
VKNNIALPEMMSVGKAKEAMQLDASPDACLLDPAQRIV